MTKAIDIVVNYYTPEVLQAGRTGQDKHFKAQVRMAESTKTGVGIQEYLRKMDAAGIERSLLIAVRAGDQRIKGSYEIPYEMIAEVCAKYPDRLSGLAGVDPTRGMQGLRDLETAITKYNFVGAHFYPHWFNIPPDGALIYPYYAKCCELDVPIMMQVGHSLIYSRDRRMASVGRPITLDQVAIDFPELVLIGIHIGVPWTDEMISMCWKHENVYTAGDAYAPKHWPKQYIHYANSYGASKVLFGSDWPVIDPERAVREVNELGLKPAAYNMLMRENALRIFKKIPR